MNRIFKALNDPIRREILDLLNENMGRPGLYEPIHLKNGDIELAFTHSTQYGEEYYSFVNGQHTSQGGTHLLAFREALVKTVREFYKKDFDAADIRASASPSILNHIHSQTIPCGFPYTCSAYPAPISRIVFISINGR